MSDSNRLEAGGQERQELGYRIRARRKRLNLTITQVAKEVGVTSSFLSQVETGKAGISIGSLRAISKVLGVPIFHFLIDENSLPAIVVRKNARKTLRLPDSRLTYELLVPDLNRELEFWMAQLEPGAASSDAPLTHDSEECVLVLQGMMELQVGEETFTLYEGDSIYVGRGIPHCGKNAGNETLIFVSASTPPVF